ncbi:MAG: adenylyltransferase/cytidyltransferase family protein [Acidimicrobiales bacterium]
MSLAPTGLVIGRFIPPHLGHSHLIEEAISQVDRLVVMVNSRDGEPVPGDLRASWLAELHPLARVVEVRHDLDTDFNDAELWTKWVALFSSHWPYADGPHIVFSSEPYGSELGRRMGARSVVVDSDRATVPISGTLIRERPREHLDYLAPVVRTWVEENWT